MSNRIIFLSLAILFSCSEKGKQPNSNLLEDFSYTVDTVFIEPGDELLFLQSGLSHSSFSSDQTRLYNFTPKDELEEIDLDDLRLLRKISTEKEGPLGTGHPYAIQIDQSGILFFYGFNELRKFSPDLDSMQRYLLTERELPSLAPEMLAPFALKIADGGKIHTLYETTEQVPQGIAVISLEDMIVQKIPLELADKIVPFTFSLFVQGRLSNKSYEPIHLILVNGELIVSTAFFNQAIVVDLEREAVTERNFHSKLTDNERPAPTQTSAETINELQDLIHEANKGVKFGPFYFDRENRQFWRFSRELDREIGDSLIFRNVLTVFDGELNQLGETVVPVDPFSKKFIKDGKLWSYVNVEDELGFAVFTFDFKTQKP